MRRLFDTSQAVDVLEGPELDAGVAELVIEGDLCFPLLTPQRVAERVGVSRSTPYRAFAADDGIMQVVRKRRLSAVAAVLSDPLATRDVARRRLTTASRTLHI